MSIELVAETPYRWRIERTGAMRVPGIVFAVDALLLAVAEDRSLVQVANVATLPGIVEASYAMPDVHWGYGFPIGGVAATDIAAGGVVSPGGVGFDISCGVRLLCTDLDRAAVLPRLDAFMDALDRRIPRGLGPGGVWEVEHEELEQLLREGARYAVAHGHGSDDDLQHCEDGGALAGARPLEVSSRAFARGAHQVGSLGAGNHFLEVQIVDEIVDPTLAAAFGLALDHVCVMIHSGSRGLGHQICQDHVGTMLHAMARYGIDVPDRQLACAPVNSPEGRAYLGAMAAAANYGRANRQLLTEAARDAFAASVRQPRPSFAVRRIAQPRQSRTSQGRRNTPRALRPSQGRDPRAAAGRPRPPRRPARRRPAGARAGLHGHGVMGARRITCRRCIPFDVSRRGLAEEAPFSYKDVDLVVATCEHAGLARRVARLRPIGVVKG